MVDSHCHLADPVFADDPKSVGVMDWWAAMFQDKLTTETMLTDDPIKLAQLMGSGDAVIGVNPATDSVADYIRIVELLDTLRSRLDIPTQTCCLGHVTTALKAIAARAPVDLVFQSVAGTEAANRSFGVDLALLQEGQDAALSLRRGSIGDDVMYFETGQGSALPRFRPV